MARFAAILTMAFTGLATMYAGSLGINPGDTLNPNGTVSIGLLPNNGVVSGTGLVSNPDGITGTLFAQRNYYTAGAVLGGGTIGNSTNTNAGSVGTNLPGHVTSCAANCQNTIYTPASGPTFNLLGDSVLSDDANNSNFWYSVSTGTGAGASTITIPVGIFGVNTVSTMLGTVAGLTTGGTICANGTTGCTNTKSYATISFEFNATDATGATGTDVYETLALINGVTQQNILDGYSSGTSSTSASYLATDTAGGQVTVQTGTEWSGTVNVAGAGNVPPVNTTLLLGYQIFPVLSAFQNDYLVSVSITDTGTAATNHEVLSGITVNTPEPSTVLMFLGGFGAIGIARLRRRRS